MGILSLKRDLKDLERLREITTVLVEEGYHAHLAKANLAKHAKMHARIRHAARSADPTPERARKTMERLGPTFVKLAQVLSLRPDLVPHEYCEEFRKLQDHVEPFPYVEAKNVVESELAAPLTKVFKSFSKKPIASASIAQVHRATLLDGTQVVVKVQRPKIRELMAQDIDIMSYFARKLDHSKLGRLHFTQVVEEFRSYTERELSFRAERANTQHLYDFFKDDPRIVIPEPCDEYSTDKVFVMEYIEGTPLSDREALKKAGFDLTELEHICAQAVLKQVFEHNLFHADPHPGNLLAFKRGKKAVVAVLDFGIVGYIDERSKREFMVFLNGMLTGDAHEITKAILRIGEKGPEFDEKTFEQKLSILIADWNPNDLGKSKFSSVVYNIALLAIDQDVRMPPYFVTTAKALVTMEGTAMWLNPHTSIANEVRPYLEKMLREQYGPEYLVKEARKTIPEAKEILEELPDAAEAMIDRIRKGSLEIHIDGKEIGSITREYDLEMNRRNVVLLAGALFLGSALLAALSPEAKLLSYPLYGWGFMGFAIMIIAFLHLSMKIHKKLEEEEQ